MSNSTILIIEDDEATANKLAEGYSKAGDKVIICTDPLYAVNTAKSHEPQLVIISVALAGMDGFLLALDLKKEKLLEDIPIVFITPEINSSEITRLAFTIGAIDVLTKPLQTSEVDKVVQESSMFKNMCQLKQLALKLSGVKK